MSSFFSWGSLILLCSLITASFLGHNDFYILAFAGAFLFLPDLINFASVDKDEPECFGSEIFDIVGHFGQLNPGVELPKTPIVCKPSEAAIARALKIAGLNPQRTLFFEDSVRNIQAGKRVGLDTVLIGTSQRVKGADYALESIHNLREGIPELWNVEIKSNKGYAGKVAVETSVTA
ncbi:hypothetical protein SDJN03_20538, partial [Cucurbita argyrosperma subsp. sororia]